MRYCWTLSQAECELLNMLAAKVGPLPHSPHLPNLPHVRRLPHLPHLPHMPHLFHTEVHGDQPASLTPMIAAFVARHESEFPVDCEHTVVEIDETERRDLLHELNRLLARLQHESNNLAFVPTSGNPQADFWDLLSNTEALMTSLSEAEPVVPS